MKYWYTIAFIILSFSLGDCVRAQNQIQELNHGKNEIVSLHFLPDGNRLISASSDSKLVMWDVQTGKRLWQVGLDEEKDKRNYTISHILGTALSPDGHTIAISYQHSQVVEGYLKNTEQLISLLSVKDGQAQKTLAKHKERTLSLVFSPDGHSLAAGVLDGTVRFWDMSTGQQIRIINFPQAVSSIAFSPDNKFLAVGLGIPHVARKSKEIFDSVIICDVQTGQKVIGFPIKSHYVVHVAFSSDGLLAVLGQMPTTLTLWNPETGELVKQYKNLEIDANNIFISSKERLLLLEENRERHGRVLAWDMQTNTKIRSFSWRETSSAIALSADRKLLAVGFESGKIRLLGM